MTRLATDRFLTAVLLGPAGVLVAVITGHPHAVLVVAPWLIVLTLGLSRASDRTPTAAIAVSADRVVAGDPVEVTTEVKNASGSIAVTCRPSPGLGSGRPRPGQRVTGVVVGGRARVTGTVVATEWGTHDFGRVTIELTEPYGLFRRIGQIRQPSFVRVHPTTAQLSDLLTPRFVRRVTGTHGSTQIGRGVEYADLRSYTPGDSLRDVNWRATARSTDVWVSQRHPDRATDVVLLLDTFVESGHDARAVVGMAVEAMIGLADSHLAATDRVGLVELGGVVRWVRPGTGRRQLQQLTDAVLATGLHANAADKDLGVIPPHSLPPRSFVIALSPLLDRRFVDAVFVLAGRGHDIAVIECQAGTDEAAPAVEPHLTTARRLWAAERQIVRDRLAEVGVAVAGWDGTTALDPTLADLSRRRRRVGVRRR